MRHAVRSIGLALLLVLAGCKAAPPAPVAPALWEVRGPNGEHGWLFGTIHALPERVAWRSPPMDAALSGADRIVMEIGNADKPEELTRLFSQLARGEGEAPVEQRVDPALRAKFRALLDEFNLNAGDFANTDTWAVALQISRAAQGEAQGAFGLEAELMRAAAGKPVTELEGAEAQFRMFESLPEQDQRDLLDAIVVEASATDAEDRLGAAWKRGDMALMEAETRTGLLADRELREALLTSRNVAWAGKVAAMMRGGAHPFVAVGAAHMAGPDGMPALLAARGFTVTRVQ